MMRRIILSCVSTAVLAATANAADLSYTPESVGGYKDAPAPYVSWTGLYGGLIGGYGSGKTSADLFVNGVPSAESSFGRSGGFGGAEVGYNVMVAPRWLVGIEGDASAAAVDGTGKVSVGARGSASTDSSVNMISTVRGRLGYTFGNLLIYGTGGVAVTGNESTTKITMPLPLGAQSSSARGLAAGWTAGGGVEWAFSPAISAKAEYLFVDFDAARDLNYTFPQRFHVTSETQMDLVRVGLNYHFGTLTSPLK
jgi:outer membrane immunogenic protein